MRNDRPADPAATAAGSATIIWRSAVCAAVVLAGLTGIDPACADPGKLTVGPTIAAVPGSAFVVVTGLDPDPAGKFRVAAGPQVPSGGPAVSSFLLASERNLSIALPDVSAASLSPVLGYTAVPDYPGTICTESDGTYGRDTAACDLVRSSIFQNSQGYSLTLTTNVVSTAIAAGSVTATVSLGGTGRVLGSATAASSAAARSAALAAATLAGLPGRVLAPVATSAVIQTTSDRTTYVLTGRDSYEYLQQTNGGAITRSGNLGRCDHPNGTCEGGLQLYVAGGAIVVNDGVFTDLYVAATTMRTITETGQIALAVPIAAAGRVHPSMQTMGFDLSARFLAALGDAAARPLPAGRRAALFLEGVRDTLHYARDGATNASRARLDGVRGGVAVAVAPDLRLTAAGEGGHWRWTLDDATLPESAMGNAWRAGLGLAWTPGRWRVGAAGFVGDQAIRSTAASIYAGGTSTAHYRAHLRGGEAHAGYALAAGPVAITPQAGIEWLGWSGPTVAETGGLAPLTIATAHRSQTRPWAGLAADYAAGPVGVGVFGRVYEVLGDRTGAVVASDGQSSATPFVVTGAATGRSGGEVGGRVGYTIADRLTLGASASWRRSGASRDAAWQVTARLAL